MHTDSVPVVSIQFSSQGARVKQISQSRNRNRNLHISKAPLKSQAQSTSLFMSAATNKSACPKGSPG